MPSLTVENYVKAIYQIASNSETTLASTGELARRLEVSPGSVTSMLRTLSESGLADYQAYGGVRLTDDGERLALAVLRRHRLVELFLTRTLGLTWEQVHAEAETLEHAVSDWLVDRIDQYLGFPEFDPHGDPIPKADGSLVESGSVPLSTCKPGSQIVLDRVMEQSPEFLKYLRESGIAIGSHATVAENHPQAGSVLLRTDQGSFSLSRDMADQVLVHVHGGQPAT